MHHSRKDKGLQTCALTLNAATQTAGFPHGVCSPASRLHARATSIKPQQPQGELNSSDLLVEHETSTEQWIPWLSSVSKSFEETPRPTVRSPNSTCEASSDQLFSVVGAKVLENLTEPAGTLDWLAQLQRESLATQFHFRPKRKLLGSLVVFN